MMPKPGMVFPIGLQNIPFLGGGEPFLPKKDLYGGDGRVLKENGLYPTSCMPMVCLLLDDVHAAILVVIQVLAALEV